MIRVLRLPNDYPFLFRHAKYIAPRISTRSDGTMQTTTTIYQTPNIAQFFTTLALSYDSQTRITTGFLGYVDDADFNSEFLPSIMASLADSIHPFMLPIICYNNFVNILGRDTAFQAQEQRDIAQDITRASNPPHIDSIDFPQLHQRLISVHNTLTNAMPAFIKKSSVHLREELGRTLIMVSADHQRHLQDKTEELIHCIEQMDIVVTGFITTRDRIVLRIESQFRVLYNLMQQRDNKTNQELATQSKVIAEASARDSSAMKVIAVVTMLFLPGTAIATMFSMSVFFGSTDDFRVKISPSFWVYWAVTIPLTILIITIWSIWIQSEKLAPLFFRLLTKLRSRTTTAKDTIIEMDRFASSTTLAASASHVTPQNVDGSPFAQGLRSPDSTSLRQPTADSSVQAGSGASDGFFDSAASAASAQPSSSFVETAQASGDTRPPEVVEAIPETINTPAATRPPIHHEGMRSADALPEPAVVSLPVTTAPRSPNV